MNWLLYNCCFACYLLEYNMSWGGVSVCVCCDIWDFLASKELSKERIWRVSVRGGKTSSPWAKSRAWILTTNGFSMHFTVIQAFSGGGYRGEHRRVTHLRVADQRESSRKADPSVTFIILCGLELPICFAASPGFNVRSILHCRTPIHYIYQPINGFFVSLSNSPPPCWHRTNTDLICSSLHCHFAIYCI